MEAFMSILGSVVAPLVLLVIGWRGIPVAQRGAAMRVMFGIFGVILIGTCVYVAVMVVMSPRWIAADCEAGAAAVARTAQASDPLLAHDPFMAACQRLPMSAAQCANVEYAAQFPHSCDRYVDEIHAELPSLELPVTQRPR